MESSNALVLQVSSAGKGALNDTGNFPVLGHEQGAQEARPKATPAVSQDIRSQRRFGERPLVSRSEGSGFGRGRSQKQSPERNWREPEPAESEPVPRVILPSRKETGAAASKPAQVIAPSLSSGIGKGWVDLESDDEMDFSVPVVFSDQDEPLPESQPEPAPVRTEPKRAESETKQQKPARISSDVRQSVSRTPAPSITAPQSASRGPSAPAPGTCPDEEDQETIMKRAAEEAAARRRKELAEEEERKRNARQKLLELEARMRSREEAEKREQQKRQPSPSHVRIQSRPRAQQQPKQQSPPSRSQARSWRDDPIQRSSHQAPSNIPTAKPLIKLMRRPQQEPQSRKDAEIQTPLRRSMSPARTQRDTAVEEKAKVSTENAEAGADAPKVTTESTKTSRFNRKPKAERSTAAARKLASRRHKSDEGSKREKSNVSSTNTSNKKLVYRGKKSPDAGQSALCSIACARPMSTDTIYRATFKGEGDRLQEVSEEGEWKRT